MLSTIRIALRSQRPTNHSTIFEQTSTMKVFAIVATVILAMTPTVTAWTDATCRRNCHGGSYNYSAKFNACVCL
ncbi:unnamed protein product [Zymoseptoria tritici ST99CH_3D7]|uniref:Uncharacterized protein n=1 Tax=Zymoseptoria tritici (strain ST99CH_3D7) TaxID=1276538 RepID=A0A1X7RI61_ZYMT9|nr:unnamed protein product [Zymoseptoria tritici ST99CH_3D7]